MLWTLAQMDLDEALAKSYWNLAMIVLIGLLGVVFFVAMFLLRRWKHRELKAIDARRAARRARQANGPADAWAASSERYIDHDKLPEDDSTFPQTPGRYHNDDQAALDSAEQSESNEGQDPDDEDRDPYGLFADKPYQEPEEEDDFDDDMDDDTGEDDWDEDEDEFEDEKP